MKRVEGKVAIVTGASSGIERAIAKLFAQEGAKVVLASTTASKGHQVEDEIKSQGGEAFFIQTDVTSSLDLECLVKTTLDKYGQIDIFVNNAGIPDDIDENITEERLHRIMGVNFNGPFLLSRTVISHMKKQGSGNIINVISVGGMQSTRRACVYSATKAGMNMMTRNMARMHGKYNIRVNCVAPSQNETSIWWQSLDREPT